ncbi:MAG: PorV/PorQ family protein [Bacteroidetes bacterium]|nr:PorV/PorQ family protein [Bacteroidota bacterium]
MKKSSAKIAIICAMGLSVQAFAGNKDRTGQSGATELSINPWGQSTGVFGMNTANVKGIDALKTNIAGLAFVNKTEVGASYSMFLRGTKVGVNNLGFAQKLGNSGVVGVNIMAMSFGEIPITDYNNPEGQIGTYSPQFFNVQLGFAKEFSNHIYAGVGATFVSEQITNVKASGAAFEAGIQYVTGARNNFHFGITLRNIGTNMRFGGNGFSVNVQSPENEAYTMNMHIPSEKFEMPTYLNFGLAYDFYLDENSAQNAGNQSVEKPMPKHRLTVMGSFTSNSFNNDFIGAGFEYAFREMFMLRAAYRYEKNIGSYDGRTTMYTGLSAGATVQQKIGENGPRLAIDYSYRPTARPANGVHVFSLRFMR